eukprot:2069073-Prymnesium_polylepis.1
MGRVDATWHATGRHAGAVCAEDLRGGAGASPMGGSSSKAEPAGAQPEGFGVRVRATLSTITDSSLTVVRVPFFPQMTPALLQSSGVTGEHAQAKAEQTYDRDELARQAFQQGAEYAAQQLMQQQVCDCARKMICVWAGVGHWCNSSLLASVAATARRVVISAHNCRCLHEAALPLRDTAPWQAELEAQARQQQLE